MATALLNKYWVATFDDDTMIVQPEDDSYSGHDETKEWNPSAFRDILDKGIEKVVMFTIMGNDTDERVSLDLTTGEFWTETSIFTLEDEPLRDRKLIYYREIERTWVDGVENEPIVKRYVIGYEGKNSRNKVEKKVIYING